MPEDLLHIRLQGRKTQPALIFLPGLHGARTILGSDHNVLGHAPDGVLAQIPRWMNPLTRADTPTVETTRLCPR